MTWVLGRIAAAARFTGEYGTVIVGLCGIVILWAGLLWSLSVERQVAIDRAIEDTNNFARAVQEETAGIVRAIDQTLLYARSAYLRAPDQFDVKEWSREFLTNSAFQLAFLDKDGQLLSTNLGPVTSSINLRDREHFRFQAASSVDRVFIGKPVILRLVNKPAVQFTRRMVGPDGAFAGVVSVSLDPSYLSQFYDSLDLGRDGVVVLVGTDGIIRARASRREVTIADLLADIPIMRMFAEQENGSLDVTSQADGVKRISSYRAIKGYPLFVLVAMSERDVLAQWAQEQRSRLTVASAVSVVLLTVVISIVLHQARLRRALDALRESEAQHAKKSHLLDVTLQNMDQGIIKMDAHQLVEVINRRMGELFDLPESVTASRHTRPEMLRLLWQRGEFGADYPDFDTWFERFSAAGGFGGDGGQREHRRPNGRVLEVRGRSLPDGGAVQTFTDVTERKQAEETLRDARDAADRSARAKSEFLAMMSHEIRTPMSGLLGIIELLRETPLAAEQLSMIELVHDSAASLLRIVNDILDFSKMEAGRLAVNLEPVDLRQLVATAVEPTTHVGATKGLLFVKEVAADVPAWVMLDPLRLRQILTNLLGNAIKFTASGTVSLTVTREEDAAGEETLCFAVSDTGIGMSPEQLSRLFEPFNQGDISTTKIFGGTGLGLTISRRLARLLGGDITVESQLGKGCVFRLRLQLLRATPAAASVDDNTTSDPAILGPMRILVAEDQETNRWLIEHQLERLGCTVTAVANGRAALAALAGMKYDVLITDCHMPEIDGPELTRLVRAAEVARGTSRMVILGLTADVSAEMRTRCIISGMNDVVGKPINLQRLGTALAGVTYAGDAEPVADSQGAAVVFDPATCRELFGPEEDEGREWLAAYLDAAADLVSGVERDIASGDRDALAANAHKLASASLAAGAMCLGLISRRLEAAAPAAAPAELREMGDAVIAAWRDARLAVSSFISDPETVA